MNYLLDKIIEVTKEPKSKSFYLYAIRMLGPGIVEEELGELNYQMKVGNVQYPNRYLISLLVKRIKAFNLREKTLTKSLTTFKPKDINEFFNELKLSNIPESAEDLPQINITYNKFLIKLPTLLSSDFFTLSTNKALSDEVSINIQSHEGIRKATLIRGRMKKGAKESGILTSFDGRVFLSVIHLWQEKGSETFKYKSNKDGSFIQAGLVTFSLNELIKKVYPNLSNPGNKDYIVFVNSLNKLVSTPYCYYYKDGAREESFGFRLLSGFSLGERTTEGTKISGAQIIISPEITRQYVKQRTLNRPEHLTKTFGEIAFILWLYIAPRVASMPNEEYKATLTFLIDALKLPLAKWHSRPAVRKDTFTKIIKEIQHKKTETGKFMDFNIVEENGTHFLVAKLI